MTFLMHAASGPRDSAINAVPATAIASTNSDTPFLDQTKGEISELPASGVQGVASTTKRSYDQGNTAKAIHGVDHSAEDETEEIYVRAYEAWMHPSLGLFTAAWSFVNKTLWKEEVG